MRKHFPFVTSSLITLNLVVFSYMWLLDNHHLALFFEQWALIPAQLVTNNEFSTLFTSLFLHSGWTHLLGNLLYLWLFGTLCEASLGHTRTILLYLASGLLTTFAQITIEPFSPIAIIGASGALTGLMGAATTLLIAQQKQPFANTTISISLFFFSPQPLPAILVLLFWFVWQFLNGFAPIGSVQFQSGGSAFFAHIGGFIVGSLFVSLKRSQFS